MAMTMFYRTDSEHTEVRHSLLTGHASIMHKQTLSLSIFHSSFQIGRNKTFKKSVNYIIITYDITQPDKAGICVGIQKQAGKNKNLFRMWRMNPGPQ